ncbi:MAG: xanthine dehydrogenase family protein molybdopterin-binding subunit [Alphaproteobacteria bacterium]|nr:MAG: xanthine dehydrogenase family protein molybdopterin-binding subunit [Alphaproteobacteria bacterium]TMK00450.1 MAG: xanthine dehydrogenase family protein molybdopterin-binding subunit [Alphaproteobacteria bacterium]
MATSITPGGQVPTSAKVGAQVGRSLPRLEARAKVTGRAEYTHTMRLPGMLHAKIFRSTVAHGRIQSIDVSAATKVPGVYRVLTADDVRKVIPSPYYGPAFHDQPILAIDKVHYVGEPVAVVLAADPHVAEEAAQLIVADYEELPAVFDEIEAADNKTLVHDELKPAGTFADLKHLKGRKGTNIALDFKLRRGDVDKAFAQAAHVFEHTFHTQKVLHLPLEPFASIADWNESGVTIYSATQGPSFVRTEIARLLGWPENRVRIKVPYLGGGFGAKLYIKMEALATALSMIVRRPVKVALTMEEQFYTITRHPSTFRIKTGVDKTGRITARKCEVYWNGGAYADVGPRVTQKSGFTASGPYDIDNVWVDSYALYTNLPPAGALRGFGIPQLVWGYESHTDMIARALKLDPIEFRRKNLLREGRPQATGQILREIQLEPVLDRVAERLNWGKPLPRGSGALRRGRGVAVAIKAVISPTTSVANLSIAGDGSTTLYCGTIDMGQGSDTAMAQIVGEVLDIPAETVRIVPRDTDVTPYDMGTLGSRSLYHMGHAVRLAAEEARAKIKAMAREVGEPEGSNIPLPDLFKKKFGMQAGNIVGTGTYKPDYVPPDPATGLTDNVTPFWMCAASGAEVEVDTETGHVRIARLVTTVDCGRPVNPKIVETQISGAVLMHLGFTMFENMHIDAGQVTNASLADYKIPAMLDVPQLMQNEAVDSHLSSGPFGAKGVGETATFCVSPAIGNAIEDACGVRLTSLPLTPEAVFRALRAQANAPLEDDE